MDDERQQLVRIDATGTAHPVGRIASQRLRARQGAFRLLPAPGHLVVMRFVDEDGKRDEEDGAVFRLAGEITTAGALCDIVSLVGQAAWKGELVVVDDKTSRSIFFDHGHVISASSNVGGERLGEVLYRYGALTEEEVAKTADAVTQEMRFGEAAVKLGFLTREKLFQLMGKQTEEIAYATLLVGDGMFYFLDSYDEARLVSRQNISVNSLLMEGVRRMDETKYFRERIPSEQHVPERMPDRNPPDEELRRVFDAIDGVRSVAEICRVVEQGEFEVTQVLFQLVQAGKVVVKAPRPTGPAAFVALFNQAIQLVLAEVDAIGKGGEVREQLASFATGAGVYDALFRKAGPAENGTLDSDQVTENIGVLVGPEQAESTLAQWLYEYASFAMFVAEPHLRGGIDAAPNSRRGESPIQPSVVKKVAALIAPLAPAH
jgi:hypothetical protein